MMDRTEKKVLRVSLGVAAMLWPALWTLLAMCDVGEPKVPTSGVYTGSLPVTIMFFTGIPVGLGIAFGYALGKKEGEDES